MKKFYSFYLEINKFELIFIVIEKNEINESKIIHKSSVQTQEAVSNKVLNFDLILQILKKYFYN